MKTRSRKLHRLLVWLAAIVAFFLLFIGLLAGIIVREGLRATAAVTNAKRESPATKLFAVSRSLPPEATSSPSRPPTTATQTATLFRRKNESAGEK